MIPTDEQLNRAMAEAIGWRQSLETEWRERLLDGYAAGNFGWLSPKQIAKGQTEGHRAEPDYCNDRNALPEVLAFVQSSGVLHAHMDAVIEQIDGCGFASRGHAWAMLTAAPRLHVIAALKSLCRWPADCSSE